MHGEEAGRASHPPSPTLVSPVPRERWAGTTVSPIPLPSTPLLGTVSKVPELLTYRENHCRCVCVFAPLATLFTPARELGLV